MKNTLKLVVITAALLLSAYAKDKKLAPPVYDLTASVSFVSFHADSEAHVTVNGETHSAYCNTSGTSVDCTDLAGTFVITFQNGNTTVYAGGLITDYAHSNCLSISACDPLSQVLAQAPATFHYRTVDMYVWSKQERKNAPGSLDEIAPYYCVGFTVADKKGRIVDQERCYQIMTVADPQGNLLYPKQTAPAMTIK